VSALRIEVPIELNLKPYFSFFLTLVENLTPQNKTLLLYLTISYHLSNKKPGEEKKIRKT